jgi:hypothetical protein
MRASRAADWSLSDRLGASPRTCSRDWEGAGPSLEPIAGATVGLTRLSMIPSPTMQAVTNALGEFSFESTPPSRYFLVARRLSYLAARDTIQLAADSGAVVAVTLAKHPKTLDDCSLTYTTKRVPWWQQ